MRLAGAPYCASCFGAYPERRHVDFDAFYEGPVIDEDSGLRQTVDDLIICEECLRGAAKLLGFTHEQEGAKRIEELEAQAADDGVTLRTQADYISRLESTIQAKPKPKQRA